MKGLTRAGRGLALLATLALPARLTAQVAWTDWTSATVGTAGSATGTLTIGLTPITVGYTGEVFNQTQTSGGIDYWAVGNAYSATGRPTGSDIITLTGGQRITQTITFSSAITNPVMAILSLGQPNVPRYYDFNAPFTILSSGNGYWGGNPAGSLFTTATANELLGIEGHGVIQFNGTYTSLSWTVPQEETWHGFTIGAATTVTPEPASMTLLATGLAGVVAAARRRRAARVV
jgi:hypothetical protein